MAARDRRDSGVAHRRRGVAVDGAEIALPVDQRHAQAERLRHADHGVVDRRVAVRVVLAHHLADDAGGLAVRLVVGEAALVHAVQDAAVHRLQPVARVRQRPADDDRHGVVEVGAAHLLLEHDRVQVGLVGRGRGRGLAHDVRLEWDVVVQIAPPLFGSHDGLAPAPAPGWRRGRAAAARSLHRSPPGLAARHAAAVRLSSSVSSPRKRATTTSVISFSDAALVRVLAALQRALDVELAALLHVALGDRRPASR